MMKKIKFCGRGAGLYLYLAVLSAVAVTVASNCSPLYPFNQWVDPNCFFTVGKAMANGKVLYRDIYEQKGAYVYFFHAICYLFSHQSFFWVYIAEIFVSFFSSVFAVKIFKLYGAQNVKKIALAATLFCLSVCFSAAYVNGDSVEEFCSPTFLGVLYITLKQIKIDRNNGGWWYKYYSLTEYFLIGVIAGIVFWSKFTLTGFFIAWFVFFIYQSIKNKRGNQIPKAVGMIAFGVLVATLPCLFYFLRYHAVKDWLKSYLYDNIFLYTGKGNIFVSLLFPFWNILLSLGANLAYGFFVVFGMVYFARKKKGEERALFLILPPVTAFFLFAGGRGYRYYGLPLYIFAVFGYIGFWNLFGAKVRKLFVGRLKAITAIVLSVVCICGSALYLWINGSTDYIFRKKETTAQYRFAQIINAEEGKTLLNYGFLDGGFYLAANQTPNFKYFCTLNILLGEMETEMRRYLDEGQADFVVVKLWKNNRVELAHDGYEEVLRIDDRAEGKQVTYILYKLI